MPTPRSPRTPSGKTEPSEVIAVPKTAKRASAAKVNKPKKVNVALQQSRKTIPKVVSKKTLHRITTTTEVSAGDTAKRTAKKTVPKSEPEIVVTAPSSVPLRLIERKILIERLLTREGLIPAKRIAVAGGLCFVLAGTALFWSSSSLYDLQQYQQSAQLTCTDGASCVSTSTSSTPLGIQPTLPSISFVQDLPEVLEADTNVAISATGAAKVMLVITSLETGKKVEVPLERFADTWRGVIRIQPLEIGRHRIFARVELQNVVIRSEDRYFYIRSTAPATTDIPTVATTTIEERHTVSNPQVDNSLLVVDSEPLDTSSTTPSGTQVVERTTTVLTEPKPTAIEPEVVTTQTVSPVVRASTTPVVREAELVLSLGRLVDNSWRFSITYPKNVRFVEMYLRNTRSTNVEFAGLAKQYSIEEWRFFVSQANFPPGTYELMARSRGEDGQKLESQPVRFTISAPLQPVPDVVPSVTTNTPVPTPVPVREYIKVADELKTTSTADGTPTILDTKPPVRNMLLDQTETVNDALRRYAAARQTDDSIMIESAQRSLQQVEADAMAKLVASGGGISDAEALSEQFRLLEQRVTTFERLRRERDADVVSLDSDDDGISDYDEVNLFKTDPSNPDTDGDGVWDGIEITRGFNPLDADEAALITYESPRDVVALAVPEVMAIASVKPIISQVQQTTERVPEPPILAQISGTALPNSFVTLYIFSTPTIVTVKTDSDGSFVYTFEKELQDGSHEVYVAITDNTGSIVARSNPFRFIKEAQAFTPVDAAADVVITSTPLPEQQAQNAYSMVAGIGVLALGVILLMLGLGLRTPEDDEVAVTHKPA